MKTLFFLESARPDEQFCGQRLAVEFQMPLYQNLTGTQLKTTWRGMLGWQYAFHL